MFLTILSLFVIIINIEIQNINGLQKKKILIELSINNDDAKSNDILKINDKNYKNFLYKELNKLNKTVLPYSPLRYVMEHNFIPERDKNGLYLDFGVFSGNTTNLIAKYVKTIVYGFDSFEGLPENWRGGFDKGSFNKSGLLPKVRKNVRLIKGWFKETIPKFVQEHKNEKIDLIHVDCDIYSSTKTIFDKLENMIKNETIIVFDELINYPGFEKNEFKAFYEFIKKSKKKIQWIGASDHIYYDADGWTNPFGQQAAVKITS